MDSSAKKASEKKSGEYMKAIVYGNTADKLKRKKYKKYGNNHTHQWCFYLKPYYKENMGTYVKKVEIRVRFNQNICIKYFNILKFIFDFINKVLYDIYS